MEVLHYTLRLGASDVIVSGPFRNSGSGVFVFFFTIYQLFYFFDYVCSMMLSLLYPFSINIYTRLVNPLLSILFQSTIIFSTVLISLFS